MSDDFWDRLRAAGYHANGPTKVRLCEELLKEADESGGVGQQYQAHRALVDAYAFNGQPDKMLVHFAWCLGKCDEDPENFPPDDMLWSYKWVLNHSYQLPSISREQLESLFTDAERRYAEEGLSQRPILEIRGNYMAHRGDYEAAHALCTQSRAERRDWMADCQACEQSSYAAMMLCVRDFETAANLVDETLANRLSCEEQPARQMGSGVLAYHAIGRFEDAAVAHRQWYPKVRDNVAYFDVVSDHFSYLTRIENYQAALKLFENHLSWGQSAADQVDVFRFLLVAYRFFELGMDGKPTVALRASEEHLPVANDGGVYEVEALKTWAWNEAKEVADRFDQRNGNTHFNDLMNGDWPWGY